MALPFKLKVLLFLLKFQKKLNFKKITAEEFREINREAFKKLAGMVEFPPEEMFKVSDINIPTAGHPIPIRVYQPFNRLQMPILMYFHGGGFVIGDLDSHDNLCRRLAKLSHCIVVAVHYRRAPEHKFPAAAEDCYLATKWIAENAKTFDGDASRLAVSGDSAGGNLATVVTMMCRDKGGPKISQQILIYPTTDGTMSFPSVERNGKGRILTREMMQWFVDQYKSPQTDLKDPYFSPYWSDNLKNLPPALVITAEYDPLLDDGARYAEKLKAAGVPVEYIEYQGMVHVFFQMPKYLKKGKEAHEKVAKTLRNIFGTDGIV